ncbi:hypothetical protein G6F56_000070 [Rhizopus delemar]|nr:hypothetical protein G6F56_000070 [Rhizopus delemar]
MNDYDIRIQRRDYCSMLTARGISYSNNCIFIDKGGFNLWLKKGYARSERGLSAFQTVSSQRKRNISLMAPMSANGVQFCATDNTTYGTNGAVFANYMTELFNYLKPEEVPDQTFIMDNCRIHSSSEVKQVMERFPRHKVIFSSLGHHS